MCDLFGEFEAALERRGELGHKLSAIPNDRSGFQPPDGVRASGNFEAAAQFRALRG